MMCEEIITFFFGLHLILFCMLIKLLIMYQKILQLKKIFFQILDFLTYLSVHLIILFIQVFLKINRFLNL